KVLSFTSLLSTLDRFTRLAKIGHDVLDRPVQRFGEPHHEIELWHAALRDQIVRISSKELRQFPVRPPSVRLCQRQQLVQPVSPRRTEFPQRRCSAVRTHVVVPTSDNATKTSSPWRKCFECEHEAGATAARRSDALV